jgi:hypothetical protein
MLRQKMQEIDYPFSGAELFGDRTEHIKVDGVLNHPPLPLLPKTDIWLNLSHPVKLILNGELSRRI